MEMDWLVQRVHVKMALKAASHGVVLKPMENAFLRLKWLTVAVSVGPKLERFLLWNQAWAKWLGRFV
jgi:hypothetical protein